MLKRIRMGAAGVAGAVVVVALFAAACASEGAAASVAPAEQAANPARAENVYGRAPEAVTPHPLAVAALHDAMRKLWEDHITWTRLYIVSAAAGLPDTEATAARLLQNQVDIGNAVKPYYGDATGEQLTALLRDHILIAADLLQAAKSGDHTQTDAAAARWYTNADEIATLLNQANPDNWPLDHMKQMMRDHLDLTLKEAVARLQGDYPADIAAYDEVHTEILQMADMLSSGIVAQFPNKF